MDEVLRDGSVLCGVCVVDVFCFLCNVYVLECYGVMWVEYFLVVWMEDVYVCSF